MVWKNFWRKKFDTQQLGKGLGSGFPPVSESNSSPLRSAQSGPSVGENFRARMVTLLLDFSQWFQIKATPVLRKFDWALIRASVFILALSFVLASSVSTFAANFALNSVIPKSAKSAKGLPAKSGKGASNSKGAKDKSDLGLEPAAIDDTMLIRTPIEAQTSSKEGPSPSELRKFILERNIFNAEGKLALEADDKSGLTKTKDLDFSAVPCSDEKLPVEVTGTIFTGDPKKSFIIVKDAKVPDADIYKPGDVIIEHEEYEVFLVTRGTVELRKGDSKICLALKGFEKNKESAQAANPGGPQAVRPENVETLEFDSAYITQEIGPGYANILNSAKLIPEVDGTGKVSGFKIIAITPGSLFDKMKLQNGDVIADVNGVSLRDASQGFKLYQSLQEEREITVGIVRGGEPMTRKVRVK